MKVRTIKLAAVAAAVVLAASACGNAGEDDGTTASGNEYEVVDSPDFEAGTRMADLAEAGTVKIGVKFDQPGVGFRAAGSDTPTGIDPELGKIIAGQLGIEPDKIEWVETISDNREPFLQNGTVDFVIASYSITDERRKVVGQAGPYYVTGQSLLVAKDDDSINGPDDLSGKKVCSVTGSTSIKTVEEEYGATPAGFDTYSECVDQLKVVGEPFSEERYGVGYSKDAPELCQFLNDSIEKAYDDGDFEKAFDATLGKSGNDVPAKPTLDACA